jgi:hypothetical protein
MHKDFRKLGLRSAMLRVGPSISCPDPETGELEKEELCI